MAMLFFCKPAFVCNVPIRVVAHDRTRMVGEHQLHIMWQIHHGFRSARSKAEQKHPLAKRADICIT